MAIFEHRLLIILLIFYPRSTNSPKNEFVLFLYYVDKRYVPEVCELQDII